MPEGRRTNSETLEREILELLEASESGLTKDSEVNTELTENRMEMEQPSSDEKKRYFSFLDFSN